MNKKAIPQTSKDAYNSFDPEKIGEIYKKIVVALREMKVGTYEDIARKLKMKPEQIWKRMSEAHRLGLVHRTGIRKKMASGREGFVWEPTDKLPITEKVMQGPTVSDFSKAILQPQMSKYVEQKLF